MNELIAYCGLDCSACDTRIATVNDDNDLREKTAKLWCELNHTDAIKPEHINCLGCKGDCLKSYFCTAICKVRPCCIAKGYSTCAECDSKSDCALLAPFVANPVAHKNIFGE